MTTQINLIGEQMSIGERLHSGSLKQDLSFLPIEQIYAKLQSSEKGLSEPTANARVLEQLRSSHTESRFQREFKVLLRQFTNPLVLLLVIAVVLSALVGESSDASIMFFILVSTGLLSFFQEANAGRAVEQMRKMIANKHTVLRAGKPVQVTTDNVVPGDILIFDAGDIIPADCRIIESDQLHVNESSLTGEPYQVEKSAGTVAGNLPVSEKYNCLWQGTNVVSGTATGIAVLTGNQTQFGEIASSLAQATETAFEKGIKHFGFFLLRITIVLALFILVANLYFKKPLFDSVLFSLALAVGMAPELLPAIMTFAMSAGAKRMMKKNVIVKKLSSIFNFGEVNVLCTDKTGTITEGNATVKDIVDITGQTNERMRLFACLNATLQQGFTNSIDQALAGLDIPLDEYAKINEIPYDFTRKRLSVAVATGQHRFFITKGAFSSVLDICSYVDYGQKSREKIDDIKRQEIEEKFISYSHDGHRVLGLAYKDLSNSKMCREDECEMVFLGYILLEDPLKESTLASLERLSELNIDIKIVTGDNRFVAFHVAGQIGLKEPVVLTGSELNNLSPEALTVQAANTNIFAEMEPHHKERVIKALQKSHLTVAYIGDGINDVAAINAADIGISTNNATDVAREAADFILLDKDLSVLADGIFEGRKSFVNCMKYIFITTGATFGNMFSMAGASLLLPFLPMLPKQILLNNFITDFPFLTIASDNVEQDQLARPRKWDMKLIQRFMVVFGLHSSLFDFVTFYLLYNYFRLTGPDFQTGWFLESAITEVLILFIVRTHKSIIYSKPGKLLLFAGVFSIAIAVFIPLSPFAGLFHFSVAHSGQLLAIFLVLVAYIISGDLLKIIFFKWNDRRKPGRATELPLVYTG